MESGEVVEVSRPTLDELAMALACPPTPTPMSIYSTTVSVPTPTPIPTTPSSLMPTPILIYSAVVTAPTPIYSSPIYSLVPSFPQVPLPPTPINTQCNGVFPNPAIVNSGFGQGSHRFSGRQKKLTCN